MHPPLANDALCLALLQAQERHQLFPSPSPDKRAVVVVGVSGGADSVSLLHLLLRCAHSWQLAVHVAHLDHNVRATSAQDAAWVQKLAADWDVPFHTRRLTSSEISEADNNLEAGLRRLRYGFFADVAASLAGSDQPEPTVAVAHTADDQAETILMHMLRGSGLAGLTGMKHHTSLPVDHEGKAAIRLVRPLLDVRHTQILQYLHAHNLDWREDATNRNLTFARNRLRHQILPQITELYPGAANALCRLGAVLAAENERAERLNREAFHSLLSAADSQNAHTPVRAVLDRVGFRALDVATQRGVLRCAADHLGLASEEMDFERTETLRIALTGDAIGGPTPLTAEIVWSTEPERFSLHQRSTLPFPLAQPFLNETWRTEVGAQRLTANGEIRVGDWRLTCRGLDRAELPADWYKTDDPWQAYCDAEEAERLFLTTPRPGQQFAPLGMGGRRKHLGDHFTDSKIPVHLRAGWPLLVNESSGEVVWVCGLRLAHPARLRPETRRIFHLVWSRR